MKYNFFLFLWLFVSDSFLPVFTKASFCFGIIFNTSTLKAKSSLLLKLCCSVKFRRFFIKGEKLSISLTSKLKFSRYQKIIRTPFDKNKNSNNYSIFFLSNWSLFSQEHENFFKISFNLPLSHCKGTQVHYR